MTPAAKTVNRNLADLLGCVLDAATPLVNVLESARTGTLNLKEAAEFAQQGWKIVGNASTNISTETIKSFLQWTVYPVRVPSPMLLPSCLAGKDKAIRNLNNPQLLWPWMAAVYLEEHSWGGGNSRSRGQYLNKPGSQGDYLPLEGGRVHTKAYS